MTTKMIIGFLTYGQSTAVYLPDFIDSLRRQTRQDFSLLALDNSEEKENANVHWLSRHCPEVQLFRPGKNVGFAAGFNVLIKEAVRRGVEYFLVINPDTLLAPTALAELVAVLERRPELAAAGPKVLRWDFARRTVTKIIDTCGLRLASGLRFYDVGQGEVDRGQYDGAPIIGPSGCAGLWRLAALEKIKDETGNYFDENFFMYKEDCDLAYRLQLAGLAAASVPSAVIYHDRSVSAIYSRRTKSRQVKKWSFLNQLLLWTKYWRRQNFWQKIMIGERLKMIGAYALFFEPYLLPEFIHWWRLKNKINRY